MALGEQEGRSEALESRLGFSVGRDHVSFDVDETVYPLDAIYGGSYLFVDRCFVFLSRPSPRVVNVRLPSRGPATFCARFHSGRSRMIRSNRQPYL